MCFLMYHRLDTKTVNLRPHAARMCGFRWISVDLGGKGTGWELGRSAMYLDCYEMLINCLSTVYHDLSMFIRIYDEPHLSIPYSTMVCRFLVNCSIPTSGEEREGRLVCFEMTSFFAVPS